MSDQENSAHQANPLEAATVADAARRRWLVAGVAGTAAMAGAFVAWQKYQPHAVLDAAALHFWAQSFEKPEGGLLHMADLRGKPLLVNFWATWCPPCIEELPLIDAFYQENKAKSFQVVGLAIDQPSQVKRYLSQRPLTFPNALAGFGGTELGKSLGNAEGVLPYSVMFDAKGRVLTQKAGKLDQKDLNQWLQKAQSSV